MYDQPFLQYVQLNLSLLIVGHRTAVACSMLVQMTFFFLKDRQLNLQKNLTHKLCVQSAVPVIFTVEVATQTHCT